MGWWVDEYLYITFLSPGIVHSVSYSRGVLFFLLVFGIIGIIDTPPPPPSLGRSLQRAVCRVVFVVFDCACGCF